MADLTNAQSSTPVELINETSGNTVTIDASGQLAVKDATVDTDLSIINANLTNGNQKTQLVRGTAATYSAGFANITLAAAATDVFTITGSATKTIKITRVSFSVTTTAGSGIAINASLVKRSTADTAGTSTTATIVPNDSNNSAGTAIVRSYTVNPTLGTLVGIVRSIRTAGVTAGISSQVLNYTWDANYSTPIVLRGTSQVLAVNLNGVTITGPVSDFDTEWTEE